MFSRPSCLVTSTSTHTHYLFPPSLLFRANSLEEFMSAVRSLTNPKSLKRKALTSAIHHS